ncbi:MAG: phosphate ABC transporter substrate-binding protein PstS family protein [Flavobacteriales bacterium]
MIRRISYLCAWLMAFVVLSCQNSKEQNAAANNTPLFIEMDGSSSMFPIAQQIASKFNELHPEVRISLSLSGTSNGFMKFVQNKLEINNASRPMNEDEKRQCERNGVKFIELKVAYDAIVVAVNPQNTWCDSLSTEQLRAIWSSPEIKNWNQIDSKWPDKPIHFFSPGRLSGTADLFHQIMGTDSDTIHEITTSEDHNDIVINLSRDTFGLGYFSLPYLHSNWSFAKPLAINDNDNSNGSGAILPTSEAIELNKYNPFQRPLFLYVNENALKNPTHLEFLKFFVDQAGVIGKENGYGPLSYLEKSEELRKLATVESKAKAQL